MVFRRFLAYTGNPLPVNVWLELWPRGASILWLLDSLFLRQIGSGWRYIRYLATMRRLFNRGPGPCNDAFFMGLVRFAPETWYDGIESWFTRQETSSAIDIY